MISFDLQCDAAHVFEAWFRSSDDYGAQRQRGLITCPCCGSAAIDKAVMAPNVASKANRAAGAAAPRQSLMPLAGPSTMMGVASDAIAPAVRSMLAMVAAAQAEALPRSKWVGRRFAEEARTIHDAGDAAETIIHGQATPDEAQALADDGIAVLPLLVPFVPPEARN